ncbi:MAG: patatin-like phospholipase family protein [Proteobacteria bacterium]|nr:patatin-like phospholipase family protein [Pseudomonadota bacterium]
MRKEIKIENLVFQGGGAKGIAYIGALKAFEEYFSVDGIQRVAGSSAGSITALLIGLGYTAKEIEDEIIFNLDFSRFKDKPSIFSRLKEYLFNSENIRYMYKGDVFLEWVKIKIRKKLGNPLATFKDAKMNNYKDMYFIATNLSKQCEEIFSYEHTPNMPISIAVRASMSIPFYFKPVRFSIVDGVYNESGSEIYADGGLTNNYPIELFDKLKYLSSDERKIVEEKLREKYKKCGIKNKNIDSIEKLKPPDFENYEHHLNGNYDDNCYHYNKNTFGFKLKSKIEIASLKTEKKIRLPVEISNTTAYAVAVSTAILAVRNAVFQEDCNVKSRSAFIDNHGVETTDFELSADIKNKLIQSGYQSLMDEALKILSQSYLDKRKNTLPNDDPLYSSE